MIQNQISISRRTWISLINNSTARDQISLNCWIIHRLMFQNHYHSRGRRSLLVDLAAKWAAHALLSVIGRTIRTPPLTT